MTADLCILVAHFDDAQVSTLKGLLEEEGAKVLVAKDGQSAVQLAEDHRPYLAIVSTLLPGVHGFEVCRQLSNPEDGSRPIPVVLCSDVEDPYVRARARHVGAKRVCLEPLGAKEVEELLETRWGQVDPLDLSARPDSPRPDSLFKDLMSRESRGTTSSHFSKVSDPLTGLVNESYMTTRVHEECKRATRYGQPVSLLVAQIANYDSLVDSYGRRAGDEALLEVAGVFLCESRDVDIAGRVGPAEFQLLMPNTPREGGRVAAQRITTNLADRVLFWEGEEVKVEVHCGLACLDGESKVVDHTDLVTAARCAVAPGEAATTG